MIDLDVIETAPDEWSPINIFAPKDTCKLRFFVDYKKRNDATVHQSYSTLRMDEAYTLCIAGIPLQNWT